MALDLERLRVGQIITIARAEQQPDLSWKYPILQVKRIVGDIVEVQDTDTQEFRMLEQEDLQTMFLVGASLCHRDKVIRDLIRESQTNKSDAAVDLVVAICKEAGKNNPQIGQAVDCYLTELEYKDLEVEDKRFKEALTLLSKALNNPETLKRTKATLQETVESTVRIDQGAFEFKQTYDPERGRKRIPREGVSRGRSREAPFKSVRRS